MGRALHCVADCGLPRGQDDEGLCGRFARRSDARWAGRRLAVDRGSDVSSRSVPLCFPSMMPRSVSAGAIRMSVYSTNEFKSGMKGLEDEMDGSASNLPSPPQAPAASIEPPRPPQRVTMNVPKFEENPTNVTPPQG